MKEQLLKNILQSAIQGEDKINAIAQVYFTSGYEYAFAHTLFYKESRFLKKIFPGNKRIYRTYFYRVETNNGRFVVKVKWKEKGVLKQLVFDKKQTEEY